MMYNNHGKNRREHRDSVESILRESNDTKKLETKEFDERENCNTTESDEHENDVLVPEQSIEHENRKASGVVNHASSKLHESKREASKDAYKSDKHERNDWHESSENRQDLNETKQSTQRTIYDNDDAHDTDDAIDNFDTDEHSHERVERVILDGLTEPRRLHPAAMVLSLIKTIKDTILGIGIGLIFAFKNSMFYFVLFLSLFIAIIIVSSILSWVRYTYRVENNELRIEEGIFVRKKRYISINRIHKIDLTANIIHRIFGLVKVQIDTASSGDGAEVELNAVTVADGERLRQALKKSSTEKQIIETEYEEKTEYAKQTISWRRLFIAGTTSGSVGIILAAVFAGFSQIEQLIPQNFYDATFAWVTSVGIMIMIMFGIFVLFVIWILGIAGTMIKYGNFTIEKREKELFIKRGLIETKELTIPFDRIQAIGVEQTLIRQPIKFVQVFAVVAGGSFDKMEPFPVLFPIMREREVDAFLEKFLPDYQVTKEKFIPLASRGRKFYMMRAAIPAMIIFIPVLYFFPTFSWIPGILLAISLWFGWLQHKDGAYYIEGKRLVFRKRNINKVIINTYHHRVQSATKKQHFIQAKQRLASFGISMIGLGANYSLTHLEDEDANKIADWYSYRKDKRNFDLEENE